MLGPAVHARLEEGAVGDQLRAAIEEVEQARLARGSVELLLLHQQLLARRLPFVRRHGRGCFHGGLLSLVLIQQGHDAAVVSERAVTIGKRRPRPASKPSARGWLPCQPTRESGQRSS